VVYRLLTIPTQRHGDRGVYTERFDFFDRLLKQAIEQRPVRNFSFKRRRQLRKSINESFRRATYLDAIVAAHHGRYLAQIPQSSFVGACDFRSTISDAHHQEA